MYAKPHPRAQAAREIRVYNAERRQRDQARRNVQRVMQVARSCGKVSE